MVVGQSRRWIVPTVIVVGSVGLVLLGVVLHEPIAERKCGRAHVFS